MYILKDMDLLIPLNELLVRHACLVAPALVGCRLHCRISGEVLRAVITEVEAYGGLDDPASHARMGRTPRNAAMFGMPGTSYVYRLRGCNNLSVVCMPEGTASAVYLRAACALPLHGASASTQLRLDGPGRLCKGLGITREHDGLSLLDPASGLWLERPEDWVQPPLVQTRRTGLSSDGELPWRWYWEGARAISRRTPDLSKAPEISGGAAACHECAMVIWM